MPELRAPAGEIVQQNSSDAHRETLQTQLRNAREAGQRWRRISRWSGLAIFAVGSLLLAWVFVKAAGNFARYSNSGYFSGRLNEVSGDTLESRLLGFLAVFGNELFQLLYLLILGFLASAIAARGIQFFAASEAVIDEAVVPNDIS